MRLAAAASGPVMTDNARRAYLALGRGFVIVGAAVAALALADLAFALGLFNGRPLGTALFLAVVGGLLLWTVRQADAQRARAAGEAVEPDATAEGGDPPTPTPDGPAASSGEGRRPA